MSPPRRTFLTARWCLLVPANDPAPDDLVRPHLPPGVAPGRRDGTAWCSLVGFQFLDTRVLGVGRPGYRRSRGGRGGLADVSLPTARQSG